jgi:hypothetical protein
MQAIIQQIIKELTNLVSPIDPVTINNTFKRYSWQTSDYSSFIATSSESIIANLWTQLDVLRNLALIAIECSEKIASLQNSQICYDSYLETQKKLTTEVETYDAILKQTMSELNELFVNFLPTINERFKVKNPSWPSYKADLSLELQIKLIKDHEERLKRWGKEIELPEIKLSLLQLKQDQKRLFEDLYSLGLPRSTSWTSELLQKMASKCQTELDRLRLIKPKLEALHTRFARQLTEEEIQTKLEKIKLQESQLETQLQTIKQTVDTHPLSKEKQQELQEELQNCAAPQKLIDSYEARIHSTYPTVNPWAWVEWAQDKDYYANQKMYEQYVSFLKILVELKAHSAKRTELAQQQASLKKLLEENMELPQADGTADTDTQPKKLILEATALLNAAPYFSTSFKLTNTSQATDFFLAIVNYIPVLPNEIERKAALLLKLKALIKNILDVYTLRTTYNLADTNDHLLGSQEELSQQIMSTAAKKKVFEEIASQNVLCQQYKEKYQLMCNQIKALRSAKVPLISIRAELAKTTVPFEVQIREAEGQLLQYQIDITNLLAHIHSSQALHELSTAVAAENVHTPQDDNIGELTASVVPPSVDIIQSEQLQVSPVVAEFTEKPPFISTATPDKAPDQLAHFQETLTDTAPSALRVLEHPASPEVTPPLHEASQILATMPSANIVVQQEPQHGASIISLASSTAIVNKEEEVLEASQESAVVSEPKDFHPSTPEDPPLPIPQSIAPSLPILGENDSGPNANELRRLQQWNILNSEQIKFCSPEIQQWYNELYALAERAAQQTPYCYQYSHLINDINLNFQRKANPYLLDEYRKICPKPNLDVSILLKLKPNVAVQEQSFEESSLMNELNPQLKKLFSHYQYLKAKHPIEAQLLLQATYSAHCVIDCVQKSKVIEAPTITSDPYYAPLKRHRGILKIWELIEDFFNLVVGKLVGKPVYEYSQRPCFFKTQSSRLLCEADLLISQLPSAPTAA